MTVERIGPYKVITKLGEGGMGEVYEAVHEAIEKRVAIKILHPEYARTTEFANRFFNEARAVNRVDHPGLVQVNDYGQLPDGTAYIVMELLRGETLGARLKGLGGRLPLRESLQLLRQVAAALSAAHAKGIVHRDLKPDNIMIVPDPETPDGERTKLLDFGIAKLVEDATDEKQVRTRTNQLIGTPRYMSPEQCRGAGGVDERTDVYSLGVILYQLVAQRPPFIGAGSGELMAMHIYEPPPPLDKVPPETPDSLVQLVYRMLAKDKAQRPSMQVVVAELAAISGSPSRPASESSGVRAQSALPTLPERPAEGGGYTAATIDEPGAAVGQSGARSGSRTGGGPGQLSLAPAAPVRTRARWPLAAGAVAAAGVIVAALLGVRGAHQPGAAAVAQGGATAMAATAPATPAAPEKKLVRWSIDSEPRDAEVVRISDGAILGKTPWVREKPADEGVIQVRLRHAGFAERQLDLDLAADITRRESLAPLAGGAATEGAQGKVPNGPAEAAAAAGAGAKRPPLKHKPGGGKPAKNEPKQEQIEIE